MMGRWEQFWYNNPKLTCVVFVVLFPLIFVGRYY